MNGAEGFLSYISSDNLTAVHAGQRLNQTPPMTEKVPLTQEYPRRDILSRRGFLATFQFTPQQLKN